mmetsp:Transcript_65557/g.147850  ORF Transcript_65557/g.147850 Transcript_65557/m.147850 type:complete len:330 (-) Transcript_65557:34-1023(-)
MRMILVSWLSCLFGPQIARSFDEVYEVSMLQTSVGTDLRSNLAVPDQGPVSSFVVNNWQAVCIDGPSRALEASLAVFKAGPAGMLANDTYAKPNTTCAGRGYKSSAADMCWTELRAYRFNANASFAADPMWDAMYQYASKWNLDKDTARIIFECTCDPGSLPRNNHERGTCASLPFVGSFVHQDPETHEGLVCNQGPYAHALRSLAVLKSSAQLPMHLHDTVSPVTCDKLGFPEEMPRQSGCYPPLREFTRERADVDKGTVGLQRLENYLVNDGGMARFVASNGLNPMLNNGPACNCLPQSAVGSASLPDCQAQSLPRSPERDHWEGGA